MFLRIIATAALCLSTAMFSAPKNETFTNVRVKEDLQTKRLGVSDEVHIGGDLTVKGNTTIQGDLTVDGTINGGTGGGLVSGPATSTVNAVAVFANTTGNQIKETPVIIDGTGNVSGSQDIELDSITKSANTVSWPPVVGAVGTFLGITAPGQLGYTSPAGGGDVSSALNFTVDNKVVLTDVSSGAKNVKESTSVVIDGSDNITGVNSLTASTVNAALNGNASTATNALNVGTKTALEVQNATTAVQNATNSNIPGTIVLRASGTSNFSIGTGTMTGNITGNAGYATTAGSATTAGTATNFSGSLAGNVSGTQGATVVDTVGGQTSAAVASAATAVAAATSSNTAGTLVRRDGSGNFAGGTITASLFSGPLTGNVTGNLFGNADTATLASFAITATNFSGPLLGDVTGTQGATVVSYVGGKTAAQVATSVNATLAATALDVANTIVKRDGSKNFATNMITIDGIVTNPTDAATKDYVDQAVTQGIVPKTPVLVTSITQTATAGSSIIDGVTVTSNDRVLLTAQTYQIDNGLWLAQDPGIWTRPTDFANGDVAGRAFVLTTSGTDRAGTGWLCDTPLAIIGTDTITFVQFSNAGQTIAANVGTGVGQIFRNKTGQTLNFKTLAEGPFIDITNGANELTLAVTATSDNTFNTIVSRDASGNFSANTITAALTGAASLNVLKAGDTMTGNLTMASTAGTRHEIDWQDNSGANTVGLRAPAALGDSYSIALPENAPIAGQYLRAVTSSTTTWTTVDAPPAATKTYYVSLDGNDTNDGSLSAPLRTVKEAISRADAVASASNPVTISVGSGVFVEDNSGSVLTINADGIGIIGNGLLGTIIVPSDATQNLLQLNTANIKVMRLSFDATGMGSDATAISLSTNAPGFTLLSSVGITSFKTGISLQSTTSYPVVVIENFEGAGNETAIEVNNIKAVIKTSLMQGPLVVTYPTAATGITATGSLADVGIFSCLLTTFTSAVSTTGNARVRIIGSNFEQNINGVTCDGGSETKIVGSNFLLNPPTAINVAVSGAGTNIVLDGCLFDCADADNNPQGTAVKSTSEASAIINASTIKRAVIGLLCGTGGDTATTILRANGTSITETTTSIRQMDTSKLEFVGGSLDIITLDITNPTNVDFAAFNADGETHLAIGKVTDTPSIIYEILNGQTSLPNLSYQSDYYGHKGTVYANTNNNPTFSGVQSDINDACYCVVTGSNTRKACVTLISDSNDIGNPDNVRGWNICKLGDTAELAFTFTNNDPGAGKPNCGPYAVMQLNGFANQVEFPTATSSSLPTNATAKLLWGGDTNLYRSAADTLKTDDNFIVGGSLSTGSTYMTTLTLAPGTPVNSSLRFAGSVGAGLSSQTADRLSFDTNSVERMSISSTGTVSINAFTTAGVVHNNTLGQLSSSLIVNADVAANAGIVDTKLATISTPGKVLDSATTATSNNVFDTIVKRDTSGNFAAGVITVAAGSAASPSLQFAGSTNTGFSAQTANQLSFDTNGIERMNIQSTGTVNVLGTLVVAAGTAAQPSLKFTNGTNTGLSSATANRISLETSGVERMSLDATAVTVTAAAFIIGRQVCFGGLQVDATDNNSVTIENSTSFLLKIPQTGNIGSYAITMPSNPINGQLVTIVDATTAANNYQINAITYIGATVYYQVDQLRPNTNMDANSNGQSVTYIYYAATNTWYRCGRS